MPHTHLIRTLCHSFLPSESFDGVCVSRQSPHFPLDPRLSSQVHVLPPLSICLKLLDAEAYSPSVDIYALL